MTRSRVMAISLHGHDIGMILGSLSAIGSAGGRRIASSSSSASEDMK